MRKPTFCGYTSDSSIPVSPDVTQFSELLNTTAQSLPGVAQDKLTAADYREAQTAILRKVQIQGFPGEFVKLKIGKPISRNSRIPNLAPEFDNTDKLIRVGGRLRQSHELEPETIHSVVLDPKRSVTELIIRYFDEKLHHPGAERVLAEIHQK